MKEALQNSHEKFTCLAITKRTFTVAYAKDFCLFITTAHYGYQRANKIRQDVKKKKNKSPIIQHFLPIVSTLELFQMAI